MAELKRDKAILATKSGPNARREWPPASRTDVFSQKLIERKNGGWRITDEGRALLDMMEARHVAARLPPETNESGSEQGEADHE